MGFCAHGRRGSERPPSLFGLASELPSRPSRLTSKRQSRSIQAARHAPTAYAVRSPISRRDVPAPVSHVRARTPAEFGALCPDQPRLWRPRCRSMDFETLARVRLRKGAGGGNPGDGFCVMELVSWISGDDRTTDEPDCASPHLTAFAIALNDSAMTWQVRDSM